MLFPDPTASQNACVAILGGGGKTSLLLRLGNDLSQMLPRVLLTALTKSASHNEHPIHFLDNVAPAAIHTLFLRDNPVCIMGRAVSPEKLAGINEGDLGALMGHADCTIFECDGARNLPLKAHLPHDPPVPEFATHVVILIGADVVNTRIRDGLVHRPDIFQEKWAVNDAQMLDADFIAEVVTSTQGYLEKIPFRQPITYFINKGDRFPESAVTLARAICRKTSARVCWGSVRADFWRSVSCD